MDGCSIVQKLRDFVLARKMVNCAVNVSLVGSGYRLCLGRCFHSILWQTEIRAPPQMHGLEIDRYTLKVRAFCAFLLRFGWVPSVIP